MKLVSPLVRARLSVGLVVGLSAACTTNSSHQVTVKNEETIPLFSLFFDPVGRDASTADLLGAQQLAPGDQIVLPVECGNYDVVVMVAGGDQPAGANTCVIHDQNVCASDPFVISSANCVLAESF